MRRISLENEIKQIISRKNKRVYEYSGANYVQVKENAFSCEYPQEMEEELLKRARCMFRKPAERYPVPDTQKALKWLCDNKHLVSIIKAVLTDDTSSFNNLYKRMIHFNAKTGKISAKKNEAMEKELQLITGGKYRESYLGVVYGEPRFRNLDFRFSDLKDAMRIIPPAYLKSTTA